MVPAVKEGDLAIYYRLDKNYRKGDVIVLDNNGEKQVRRVIAVAGDTVDITADGLVINGYIQQESDIYTDTEPYVSGITFPLTVDEGQVFVLADSRPNAEDSRLYGAVAVDGTHGKVITLIRRRGM